MAQDLTHGSISKNLIRFSLPFFLSYFLQTFYGLADLFIIGQFNGAEVTTAVSVGSQLMHMVTVILVGLEAGTTVMIGRSVGAKKPEETAKTIGNSTVFFLIFSFILCAVLIICINPILTVLSVPEESLEQTRLYLIICFAGIPAITAYNVIASIFRGLGDSKSPMYFVIIACIINIIVDYILIGIYDMKSMGAAAGTVLSQGISVLISLIYIKIKGLGVKLTKKDFKLEKKVTGAILGVGFPIAVQDGFIQISFLVITAIANSRGVAIAAAVGVVEKIIGIMFLVPSSMLSSVSAIASQNAGAELHKRARKTLYYGMLITTIAGLIFSIATQFCSQWLVGLFTKDKEVIVYGGQYLRSYVFDCIFAGFQFCFSGFFTAYRKSILSFIHNVISVFTTRIPLCYLATIKYPETLFPMGMAAPLGSLLSTIICLIFFVVFFRKLKEDKF
ncbi:MAG: MATE family efflux transporter [Treponema sp.]|nr:MATE family efflux transporter [Treponema sp.]